VSRSAAATGVVLGLLFLFPIIAMVAGPDGDRHLQQIGPMTAGMAIEDTTGLRGLPIAPWAGLGVLAAWAAVSLVAGWLVLRRRDA
jgi:ABC-2 type transport system permease protein